MNSTDESTSVYTHVMDGFWPKAISSALISIAGTYIAFYVLRHRCAEEEARQCRRCKYKLPDDGGSVCPRCGEKI
jgi:uncharacterized paraquat-inducible protein A